LFDRDGYTAGRLKHIQRLIRDAGLVRTRDNGNFLWNWRKPPGPHWEITWQGFRELA
jgi:hypothetical protein